MKKIIMSLFLVVLSNQIFSQSISRIEPANWWTGMKWNKITLLIYGSNINDLTPTIVYEGVSIDKVEKVENPNYLFVILNINSEAKSGILKLNFKKGSKTIITKDFPLLEREKNSANRKSFSQKDNILLLVPDRFSNGNPSNDNTNSTIEKFDRNLEGGRHGGDIQGIINNLDYIQSLGYTQIWNTPLLENNMEKYSYHGYAATDFYKIDPRFGTNEDFKNLVTEAKKRGIGLIWDVVLNHCGSNYYFVKDLPSKDWLNYSQTKTRSNHIKATLTDIYATEIDKKDYVDGWFDSTMPDLNQKNPLMAEYLIQNTIWWIEYSGISGFREDTFSYADKDFLATWTKIIQEEYPNFNIVGEEMNSKIDMTSYWQKDKINLDGYKCFLPTLMDFSLTDNLVKALTTKASWYSTWREVYQSVAQDYLFPHPENQLIFPDNHDLDRFYSRVNKDFNQWKLGIALYTTMRGIPQFYYGTELLMTNEKAGNDGQRRGDFYGGWENDTKNAFTKQGLTNQEKEAQLYFSKLLNWRKNNEVIHYGKFKHYAPKNDDVYTYFRYTDTKKVMVILNKNSEKVTLDLNHYQEMILDKFTAFEVISNKEISADKTLEIPAQTAMILEIK
ncbi:glycoside hydrolase family 13 protein [Flavobacterium sp.]|jgi:glycosidase|uniref:glycoside hydrolase family 13 protein n=1 Tax=Flavobacterium sp. TaxID=239 RepID=UPI0037C02764